MFTMMFANDAAASRYIPLVILFVSVFALGAAYTAEYAFGLTPCILCLYQRVPYAVAGMLAILALGMRLGVGRAMAVLLCGVAFLVGAAIAFYHVGVEQRWWLAVTGCGGVLPFEITLEQMNKQLAAKQPKPCDRVDWTLFGFSLAAYNLAASLFLGAASLIGARRLMRIKKG